MKIEGKDFKTIRPMNLQLLAERADSSTDESVTDNANNPLESGDKSSPGEKQNTNNDIELPKSKEELVKLLQSEADKRVSGALKTAQAKWEADYKQKLEEEKAEAAKLAKMTASEKQQHLLEKQAYEIAEREKTIAAREMKLTKIDIFSEKNLPIKLVDYVPGDTADEVKSNIETFEKVWQEAINAAIEERLKGHSPFNVSSSSKGQGTGLAKQLLQSKQSSNTKTLEEAKKSYFK